jgi:outer membrane protein
MIELRRMAQKGFALLVFAGVLVAGTASAQDRPARLWDLYLAANHDNPALGAAQEGVNASTDSLHDAYFGLLAPRANAIFDKSREKQQVYRTDNPLFTTGKTYFGNYSRTLEIVQPIFDARLLAQLHGAYASADRAEHELDSAQQKLAYDLIEAYLLALGSADSLHLAQTEEAALTQHVREVRRRMEAGLAHQTDLEEVSARQGTSAAQAYAAGAALGEAFAAIERRTGIEIAAIVPLANTIGMAPPQPNKADDWVAAAVANNPDLKALDDSTLEALAHYEASLGADAPRVELRFTDNRLDAGSSLYGGGALTSDRTLLLRLTVPLFNADGNGYPVFSDRAKWREAKYKLDDQKREIEQKVQSAFIEVASNSQRARVLGDAAASQQRVVDEKHQRFRSGLTTITDVLDSERDAYQAQRALLSARYNYLLNLMLLKRLAGAISRDDVAMIDAELNPAGAPVMKTPVVASTEPSTAAPQ